VRLLVLTAALVLTVASCRSQADIGDEQPGSPSVSWAVVAPAVPLSSAQAIAAALTVRDLPAGWDGGAAADPDLGTGAERRGGFEPAECSVILHAQDDLGKPLTWVFP
jgi:hypothetical protein